MMRFVWFSTISSILLFFPSANSWSFHVPASKSIYSSCRHNHESAFVLFQAPDDVVDQKEDEPESGSVKLLSSSTTPSSSDSRNAEDASSSSSKTTPQPTVATAVTMITLEMKRILVEELGYKRREVDMMRPELAPSIISKRLRCPAEGMPEEWSDPARVSSSSTMVDRLEQESQYPLKFPLLGISLVLFGKGLSDAIITLIKVNIDFPGASLTEQFMGVPVLGIDAVCVIVGAAIGVWTWKRMR